MNRVNPVAFLIFTILLISSCKNDDINVNNNILVQINGKSLMKTELDSLFTKKISYDDSCLIANTYIENWVKDQLLYNKAIENIKDAAWIESEVERFRRELITSRYESDLMQENILYTEILDEECEDFYNKNKDQFILSQPLIKGIYVKIPADAPGLKEIKKKMQVIDEESVDMIEKYSLQNAITYEYFMEKWLYLENITKKIPVDNDKIKNLKSKKYLDITFDDYWYFLYVDSFLNKGDNEPIEVSKSQIREILNYSKKKDFIYQIKNELYESAKLKEQVKFFVAPEI